MNVRRLLALGLVASMLAGCSSWRPAPGSPDPLRLPEETQRIRVTQTDGARFEMSSPVCVGDTLRGMNPLRYRPAGLHDPRLFVPAHHIAEIETKHHDGRKTTWFIVGSVLVLGAIGALIVASNEGFSWDTSYLEDCPTGCP